MNTENLAQSRVKVTFEVTPEEFENALNQAFDNVKEKVSIKGFRKGHVTRSIYEKTYGVESLYDEALNVIFNAKVGEVYSNKELANRVCGKFTPAIETKDFERGKEFSVSLAFDVFPTPELPQYKGLEVAKKVLEATDAEIDEAIQGLLNSKSTLVAKEDATIEKNDTAKFDFAGKVDGKLFEGGSATDYEMQIGSGQFIPGFEDQMIGMKAGETKDVNVTFPEQYPAADLAGKAAVFTVTVKEVKSSVTPELNDEFVKGLAIENVSTVEELKASKKNEIEQRKATSEKDRQVNELINKILDNTKVELPQSLIDDRVAAFKGQYEAQAKQYNIPFETFLGLMQTTPEAFDKTALEQGSRQALFSVVLNAIVEEEKMAPTKEELEAKASEICEHTKQTKEQVLQQRGADIFNQMVYDKVVDLILSSAKEI